MFIADAVLHQQIKNLILSEMLKAFKNERVLFFSHVKLFKKAIDLLLLPSKGARNTIKRLILFDNQHIHKIFFVNLLSMLA